MAQFDSHAAARRRAHREELGAPSSETSQLTRSTPTARYRAQTEQIEQAYQQSLGDHGMLASSAATYLLPTIMSGNLNTPSAPTPLSQQLELERVWEHGQDRRRRRPHNRHDAPRPSDLDASGSHRESSPGLSESGSLTDQQHSPDDDALTVGDADQGFLAMQRNASDDESDDEQGIPYDSRESTRREMAGIGSLLRRLEWIYELRERPDARHRAIWRRLERLLRT